LETENNGLTAVETLTKQETDFINLSLEEFTIFCDDFIELNTLVDFDLFSCGIEVFFNLEVSDDQIHDFDKYILKLFDVYSYNKGYVLLLNPNEGESKATHTFMVIDCKTCAKSSNFSPEVEYKQQAFTAKWIMKKSRCNQTFALNYIRLHENEFNEHHEKVLNTKDTNAFNRHASRAIIRYRMEKKLNYIHKSPPLTH
jgi:hypothetical protein